MNYPMMKGIPSIVWRMCFDYDAETGTITHREDRPRETFRSAKGYSQWRSIFAGKAASSNPTNEGYLQVGLTDPETGKLVVVYAHRLSYVLETGNGLETTDIVSHLNGDKTDNRFANLSLGSNHPSRRAYRELVFKAHQEAAGSRKAR